MSLAITPDGTKLVFGSSDNTIKVWDLNNRSIKFACKFDSSIYVIHLSNNKKNIAIGAANGSIYLKEITKIS
jgi:WD40 repeat protein